MTDFITHVSSLTALQEELQAVGIDADHPLNGIVYEDEEGRLHLNVTNTPPVYNGDESLAITRNPPRIAQLANIHRLGEVQGNEYVFYSDIDRQTYERLYDTTPRMVDDGEGGQIEYTPPYKIGVFF